MEQLFSPEKCIELLEDRREIKNLLGKYAVSIHLCKYIEIVDCLWSKKKEDISLVLNNGSYNGRKSVEAYYQYRYEKTALGTKLLRAALPEQFEGKSESESYGAGCLEFKPVQTPVIEIAGDRQTADAWWYSQGNMTEITEAGPMAFWTWGSFHVKCVRESNEWLIYKMTYFEDIKTPVGQNWCLPSVLEEKEKFSAMKTILPPVPDVAEKLHESYHGKRPFTKIQSPDSRTFFDFDKTQLSKTDSEALQEVADRDEIEQLMGRRVLYAANEERKKEMEELWVKTPAYTSTMSFGGTWGFHIGEQAVYEYYVKKHETWLKNHPTGSASVHPLRTPAIQIAKDGQSAKGIWYSIGHITTGGDDAMWVGKKVAVDFVKEDGRWKIWHICEVHDGTLAPGENFGDQNATPLPGEDPLEEEFGDPTIAVKTHERLFCWTDDFPWMPEPYETMMPEIEYSDKGFYARKKEGVDFE